VEEQVMLNYEEQFGGIDCVRQDGDRVAHLYFCNLGRYVIQDLNYSTTSEELRQVADKMDELNGVRSE